MRTNAPAVHSAPRTHEGAVAYRIGAAAELRRTLMACLLWEDTFYEEGESVAQRIKKLTLEVPPVTVAEMAREARNAMKLRHAPLWVARWLATGNAEQKSYVEAVLNDIIQRPDELTEFLSLYWQDRTNPKEKKIAASVKRGLAKAFPKFNAYSLAKYNRDGAIKLRDVLFLVHPKPKDEEQAAVWKQLVDGTLPSPDTWEVNLSGGKDKKETWERLIAERKLGILAFLRNLRNMQSAGVSIDYIRAGLMNINPDRALPFRFISAAKYAPMLEPELEQLMISSVASKEKLPGRTVLIVDNSGSMYGAPVSAKSEIDRSEAACALAILLREVCEDIQVIGFGNNSAVIPPRYGFALRDAIRSGPGGGTNTEDAKRRADSLGYDRVIIVTDEQSHQVLSNPKGKGYVVNVATYQNGIGYGKWTHIDGWSEAIVEYIRLSELDPDAKQRES